MQLHHIGYACKNIDSAIKDFKKKHRISSIYGPIYDPHQETTVCLLEIAGEPFIELVSGNKVHNFLEEDISFVQYHVCYEVNDLSRTLLKLKSYGYTQISNVYPAVLFDNRQVVYLQNELGLIELLEAYKQKLPKDYSFEGIKTNIVSTFYTETVSQNLNSILEKLSLRSYIRNKEVYYCNNALLTFSPTFWSNSNLSIILTRLADWLQFNYIEKDFIENNLETVLETLIEKIDKISACNEQLVFILCPSEEGTFNSKINKLFKRYEKKLITELDKKMAVTPVFYQNFHNDFGWHNFDKNHDEYGLQYAHKPYNHKYEALISLCIAYYTIREACPLFKVIAVDCDDTLWGGVCGEVSDVNELTMSDGHLSLQSFLKESANRGYLICLCSKNIKNDVVKVFKYHSSIKLSLDDIAFLKVNWQSKATNLKELASELNFNLNAFLFIDNSVIECNQVKQNLPQILTVQAPGFSQELRYLVNALRMICGSKSTQAVERNNSYKYAVERQSITHKNGSIESIIKNLELSYKTNWLGPKDTQYINRAAEMSLRVTQFNCNIGRYSESSVLKLIKEGWKVLQISLEDKFGSYGVIATAIMKIQSNCLIVEDMYISCRAFYKGVEYQLLKNILSFSKESTCKFVQIKYQTTARNVPARQFLNQLEQNDYIYEMANNYCLISTKKSVVFPLKTAVQKQADIMPDKTHTVVNCLIHNEHIQIIRQYFSTISRFAKFLGVKETDSEVTVKKDTVGGIIELWKVHLNLEQPPSTAANFFEGGGTSFNALNFLSDLYDHYGVKVDFPQFLASPTLNMILKCAKTSNTEAHDLTDLNFEGMIEKNGAIKLPASLNQEWLWLNNKIDNHSWHYNLPFIFSILGELNVYTFEKAIAEIVRNNPSLRTFFYEEKGHFFQEIHEHFSPNFEVLNVSKLTDHEVNELIKQNCYQEFCFKEKPPYKITLLKFPDDQWLCIVNFHHIIFDAHSLDLFIRELERYYNFPEQNARFVNTKQNDLYYLFQNRNKKINKRSLKFWQGKLKNLSPLSLPYDYTAPQFPSHKGAYSDFVIENTVHENLKTLASRCKTSLQTVCIVAIYLLLRQYGNSDIIIPISTSGRNHNNKKAIGFFSKVVPLRLNFNQINKLDIEELINYCDKEFIDALGHTKAPLHKLIVTTHQMLARINHSDKRTQAVGL